PPVGESDFPRLQARQPIDCVQMNGRETCVLPARQEYDTRDRGRHVPTQAAQCPGCDLLNRRLTRACLARDEHVGLEQHPLERDTLVEERVEYRVKNGPGDVVATLDSVRPIHEYFRLDDRYEFPLLTKSSVARQRVGIRTHAGR